MLSRPRRAGQLAVAVGLALAAQAILAGCQSYDFEPVQPLVISQSTEQTQIVARDRKPNVMLLVDTSASMRLPIDPTQTACLYGSEGTCGEPGHADCDPSVCPSRWTDLQGSISTFLSDPDAGTLARYGLSTFPGPGTLPGTNIQCVPTEAVTVTITPTQEDEDAAGLQARAASVRDALLNIKYSDPDPSVSQTAGGTPTGGSLQFMGLTADLRDQQRNNFVLLLTDGLPNCNAANVNSEDDDPAACMCTLQGGTACFGDTARVGCLDTTATEAELTDLAGPGRGIRTVVVGFGAETSAADAQDALNAMAVAGGLPRNCDNGNVCDNGESCDPTTKLCARQYYQANNGDELAAVLNEISIRLSTINPCSFTLFTEDYPASPDLIEVELNGTLLAQGSDTWTLTTDGVQFNGAACTQIKASTPDAPAVITVRTIQKQ